MSPFAFPGGNVEALPGDRGRSVDELRLTRATACPKLAAGNRATRKGSVLWDGSGSWGGWHE